VSNGRHAAGKHRRSAVAVPQSGRHRLPRPVNRPRIPRTNGAPLAVVGVALMGTAAVAGVHTDTGPSLRIGDASTAEMSAINADRAREAERASRDQERAKLEELQKQAEQRKQEALKKAEEARRKAEAARSKFALPLAKGVYDITARFWSSSALWKRHGALDMAAPTGTPVRAPVDGVVTQAGWLGSCGYSIEIRVNSTTKILLCHFSSIVRRSGTVKAGEIIGRVGSTGRSTGPHLHMEVEANGKSVNVETWMKDNSGLIL